MPRPIRYEDRLGGGWRCNLYNSTRTKQFQRKFPDRKYNNSSDKSRNACHSFITSMVGDDDRVATRGNSLAEKAKQYLDYCLKSKTKKPGTVRTDTSRLRVFVGWCNNNKIYFIEDISVQTIRDFLSYFHANQPFIHYPTHRKKPNPNSTWNKYRSLITVLLEWSGIENPPSGNKEFGPKVVKFQKNRGRCFSREEVASILLFLEKEYVHIIYSFFLLLAYTGLRASEAINLKWTDINLRKKELTLTVDTKTYRSKTIPLSPKVLLVLKKLPKSDNLVFSDNGKPYYHYHTWKNLLSRVLDDLGIEPAGLHAFRHAFGTALAKTTKNPKTIQELLGHSSIEMSMHYIHVSSKERKEAIDSLDFG